jgi:hypothetical protein
MPITYLLIDSKDLIDPKGEELASGDSIDYLKGFVADLEPGRYIVYEVRSEPGPSGHTSRWWGVILKLGDGTIISKPDPWEV